MKPDRTAGGIENIELKKIYHIKVDWETHQLYVKCRDKLSQPMAGPIPAGRL